MASSLAVMAARDTGSLAADVLRLAPPPAAWSSPEAATSSSNFFDGQMTPMIASDRPARSAGSPTAIKFVKSSW